MNQPCLIVKWRKLLAAGVDQEVAQRHREHRVVGFVFFRILEFHAQAEPTHQEEFVLFVFRIDEFQAGEIGCGRLDRPTFNNDRNRRKRNMLRHHAKLGLDPTHFVIQSR